MTLLSLLIFTAFAAETIVSPLPDMPPTPSHPTISFANLISLLSGSGQVLGTTTTHITTPTQESTPSPTATPTQNFTRKKSYTIALLGDSMIDTLGPDIPDLQSKLAYTFPTTQFTLLNYGVGGTNIDYGRERILNSYEYLGHQIPSLVSTLPDIVVVESFGYNPFPDKNGGVNRHWLALANIVDSLNKNIPRVKIVIAATIAPNAKVFGDGAPGIAFSAEDKWQRVDIIKKYLESTVAFAKSQHIPIADAYHPSLGSDGNGNLSYINAGDHIHTSPTGRQFFAEKVAGAIIANHLLE